MALRVIEHFSVPPCKIQPMFEMVGSGEKRTPKAARVFIRFPEAPEDFLGLQPQVSVNEVQGNHERKTTRALTAFRKVTIEAQARGNTLHHPAWLAQCAQLRPATYQQSPAKRSWCPRSHQLESSRPGIQTPSCTGSADSHSYRRSAGWTQQTEYNHAEIEKRRDR